MTWLRSWALTTWSAQRPTTIGITTTDGCSCRNDAIRLHKWRQFEHHEVRLGAVEAKHLRSRVERDGRAASGQWRSGRLCEPSAAQRRGIQRSLRGRNALLHVGATGTSRQQCQGQPQRGAGQRHFGFRSWAICCASGSKPASKPPRAKPGLASTASKLANRYFGSTLSRTGPCSCGAGP